MRLGSLLCHLNSKLSLHKRVLSRMHVDILESLLVSLSVLPFAFLSKITSGLLRKKTHIDWMFCTPRLQFTSCQASKDSTERSILAAQWFQLCLIPSSEHSEDLANGKGMPCNCSSTNMILRIQNMCFSCFRLRVKWICEQQGVAQNKQRTLWMPTVTVVLVCHHWSTKLRKHLLLQLQQRKRVGVKPN